MEPNGWTVKSVAFDGQGVLLTGSCSTNQCQLTAWQMKSPVDIVYFRHWRFDGHNIKLEVDSQFIAVLTTKYFGKVSTSLIEFFDRVLDLQTQSFVHYKCDVQHGEFFLYLF